MVGGVGKWGLKFFETQLIWEIQKNENSLEMVAEWSVQKISSMEVSLTSRLAISN